MLFIFELVGENDAGEAHRRRYSYQFQYEDDFIFRYERDDQHADMPEHKHVGGDARRILWPSVTLGEVVDEILEIVADREAAEETEEEPHDA